jgi:uncharacterized damage-inducible protein DinB
VDLRFESNYPPVDTLEKLIRHCTWANLAWIERLGELPDQERLHQLMSHVLLSQQVWFQRIAEEALDRDIWRVLSGTDMRTLHERHAQLYKQLQQHDQWKRVSYQRFTGEQYESAVSDILLHLCLHGMHHRGQMARYAGERRIPVPNTDFVNFCIINRV